MSNPEAGDRISLMHTSDPCTDLKPGDTGTVSFVDDLGTVFVDWDNGSRLGLVPGEDRWEYLYDADDEVIVDGESVGTVGELAGEAAFWHDPAELLRGLTD